MDQQTNDQPDLPPDAEESSLDPAAVGGPERIYPPRLPQSPLGMRLAAVGFGLVLVAGMIYFLWHQSRAIYATARPVQAFADRLSKLGLKAGGPSHVEHDVMATGADAYSIEVDGSPIYVLSFNDTVEQLRELSSIRQQQAVQVKGKLQAARVNGALVLTGFEGRPDADKITEAFKEFNGG